MSDLAAIRRNTDLMSLVTTQLKKVANTEGGEWAGPCPLCGGKDRFRVQPNHTSGPRWYCRNCGDSMWHDAIDFVMRRDGIDLPAALKVLDSGVVSSPAKRKPEQPAEVDHSAWTYQARLFIGYCCKKLWGDEGRRALAYLYNRGLNKSTLTHWWIGFNPVETYDDPDKWGVPDDKFWIPKGIVIPCVSQPAKDEKEARWNYIKIRRSTGEKKYINLTGSKKWLYGAPNLRGTSYATLFESELDALLAWQTGYNVGCCAMPANQNIRPEWQEHFNDIEDVIVCADEDEPGQEHADKLCKLPHFWRAPHLPMGKDLTEYYQAGGDVFDYLFDAIGVIPHGS